jgi:23S rRNA (cytidine1920-2'-O)/16S rRNA (cytidine1409-2'-O)-methyltransferase
MPFVSRAGQKLQHALTTFGIDVSKKICADLGCSTGGFTDCLLQHGAARVYAIDTGYGMLDWKLRNDPRVIVMERTNAMHVRLPEPVEIVTIDVAWTKQRHILPSASRLLAPGGAVISLIKPHYEADSNLLRRGVLPDEAVADVMKSVESDIRAAGFDIAQTTPSPIRGAKGNMEVLAHLILSTAPHGRDAPSPAE